MYMVVIDNKNLARASFDIELIPSVPVMHRRDYGIVIFNQGVLF